MKMKAFILISVLNIGNAFAAAGSFTITAYAADGSGENVYERAENQAQMKCSGEAIRVSEWRTWRTDIIPSGHYGADVHGLNARAEFQCVDAVSVEVNPVYSLIKDSGVQSGVLHIWGYVTEKSYPQIFWSKAFLKIGPSQVIQLPTELSRLQEVVKILNAENIRPAIYSGGTTYVEYIAKVECASEEVCVVSEARGAIASH